MKSNPCASFGLGTLCTKFDRTTFGCFVSFWLLTTVLTDSSFEISDSCSCLWKGSSSCSKIMYRGWKFLCYLCLSFFRSNYFLTFNTLVERSSSVCSKWVSSLDLSIANYPDLGSEPKLFRRFMCEPKGSCLYDPPVGDIFPSIMLLVV